jgi:hypothetical protein
LSNKKDNQAVLRDWLKNSFTQVPKIFDRMIEANGTDKVILRALIGRVHLGKGNGDCFPTHGSIARDAGVSERTVERSLLRWRELKVIDWEIVHKRTYYYFQPLPVEISAKYSDEAMKDKLDEKMVKASEVIESSKDKIKAAFEEKKKKQIEKAKSKAVDPFEPKPEKPKKNTDVYKAMARYSAKFDEVFNADRYGDDRIVITWSQKESGQIKKFILDNGLDVMLNIIDDFFDNWEIYKKKWKLDADFPTVGIIVSYGKSKIISFKNMVDSIPKKDDEPNDDIEIKHGW